MKKINLYFIAALFSALLWGCYEDKGNYDYENLPQIESETVFMWNEETGEYDQETYQLSYKIGDEVNIRPNLTIQNERETMHLKYTWKLDNKKVIGTEEVLRWKTDTMGTFYIVLDIEDEDHGTHFLGSFYTTINALYQGWGFLVLSENEGRKMLSFFSGAYLNTSPEDGPYSAEIDLYQRINGTPLPGNTFKMLEHYRKSNERKSQLLALAPNSFVDIDAFSFQNIGNSDPYFQEPINNMRDLVIMQYVDLIETEEGKLYQRRKTTNGVFHYGKFLKAPMEYYNRDGEMEVLEDVRLIPGNFGSFHNFILAFDNKNKRYLVISDAKDRDWSGNSGDYLMAGQICEVLYSTGEWPQGFTPLDDLAGCEVLYTGSRNLGEWSALNYVSVMKQNGEYYYQEFNIQGSTDIASGYSAMVQDGSAKQQKLPAKLASVITGNSLFCVVDDNGFGYNSTHPWLFVAVGNDLYLCNLDDETLTEKSIFGPLTFDSKITAMNGKCYGGGYLGVGLENGEFFVIRNDQAKNYWSWNYKEPSGNYYGLVHYHVGDLGKIIDIQYKNDGYSAGLN